MLPGRRHHCLAALLPGRVCVLLTECACVLAGSACLPGSRWQVGWGVNGVGMGQGWDGDRDGDRDRERERERITARRACACWCCYWQCVKCKPRAASLTVVSHICRHFRAARRACAHGETQHRIFASKWSEAPPTAHTREPCVMRCSKQTAREPDPSQHQPKAHCKCSLLILTTM